MISFIDVILAARADRDGRAQRRALVRHTHLSREPFAIVALQMAHEPFSALAVGYGARRDRMQVVVVPEPRNRVLSLRALTEVAVPFCRWFDAFATEREIRHTRNGPRERTTNAPQVLVPNEATLAVLGRWGRRFAFLDPAKWEVDPALVEFGQHLRFLADHAAVPGQSLAVPATTLLRRHWTTGQSDMENVNLAALNAWIDPAQGQHGADAALTAERDRTVGPLLDPEDENEIFDQIVKLNREREGTTDPELCARLARRLTPACRSHLESAWELMWDAVQREIAWAPGASVGRRWTDDCQAYTEHIDWTLSGGRRRARHTIRQAARLRERLERAQQTLETQEACDDPLTMATYELAGKAVRGEVTRVDRTHREMGNKRLVERPLVTLRARDICVLPVGQEVWWSEDPGRIGGLVHEVQPAGESSLVTVKITHGMRSDLPTPGTQACFSTLTLGSGLSLPLPLDVPWTHQPPTADPTSNPVDDPTGPAWEEVA